MRLENPFANKNQAMHIYPFNLQFQPYARSVVALVTIILSLTTPERVSAKDIPAFPGAEGFGRLADQDHDGMPDVWEKAHKLNPTDPADRNGDRDGDGYTNLEEYLNNLCPR